MTRPRLLDLFCCAGGAAMGYHRAGFAVVGVDIEPQPHYPFESFRADALGFLDGLLAGDDMPGYYALEDFAAIHASPPCQDHMRGRNHPLRGTGHLLADTRERLQATDLPWVIENVPGAPMRVDYKLCGCMFGLPNLKRERWFETSWNGFDLRYPCLHDEPIISVTGTGPGTSHQRFGPRVSTEDERRVMGIDWMVHKELVQAIPPAYTEYIGGRLMEYLTAAAAA